MATIAVRGATPAWSGSALAKCTSITAANCEPRRVCDPNRKTCCRCAASVTPRCTRAGTDMPSAPMVDRSTFAIRGIGNDGGTSEIPGFGEASGGVVFRMFLREPARNRRSSGRNRKLSSDHLAATLSIRISPRANRSAWPHRNRTPVQIGNSAAWLSRSEVPTGKRSRLGQPNPHPKIVKLGNKSGHFLTAMKQGLDTTTTTHKRYLNKTTRSAVHKRSDAPGK